MLISPQRPGLIVSVVSAMCTVACRRGEKKLENGLQVVMILRQRDVDQAQLSILYLLILQISHL